MSPEGARVAEHMAVGAARAAQRLEQARQQAGAARGTVACRQPQTAVIPREPIDGDQLLTDTYVALNHFAIWPSEAALVTATLFAAQAHGKDEKTGLPVWQYAPRLFLTSEEGGSGKSWMGRLISKLAPDGETLIEPTKAALIQMISERKTVTITEADILFGAGGRNRGIVGVLNAGYEPDRSHTRMRGRQAERVPLFGPVILDGLESLIKSTGPDLKTLVSRCIVIKVRRGPEGYRPPRFDKTARAVFARGGEKLAQWMAQQVRDGIGDVVPEVPEGLGNRPAALWEPLLAVADAAGGDWPQRARQACTDLESAAAVDEDDDQEADYRATLSAWAAGTSANDPEEEL
jgi:hypothetical protein